MNVLQEEVSKSLAIIKVLKYFDIDKSEAIAFGDGENDIDMLELVGLGIAMGNGNEKLKTIADFVTKKSSEDGIEFALKKYWSDLIDKYVFSIIGKSEKNGLSGVKPFHTKNSLKNVWGVCRA